MKLVQLNTWGGRLDSSLGKFLKSQDADFLCLQEAVSLVGPSAIFLPVEEIQEITGLEFSVFAPTFSINFMHRKAGHGNCIISRLPIQKSEVIFTNQEYEPDFDFVKHKNSNMRNFVHAVVDLNGQKLNLLTHHGYWIQEHKNGNPETLRQMKQLGEYIDDLDGPVILTGDFNLAPDSESIGLINQRLTNLSTKYKLTTTRTNLTHKKEVCDYIFVSDDVKVKSFTASDEVVSDHKALILEFDV